MKRSIIAALAIVAMVACTKEERSSYDGVASDVEATFSNAQIGTRTSGNEWESNDEVGITMYKSGSTTTTGYALAKENVYYTSDASGNFSIATGVTPIYYPQTDEIDFYAYYPYQSGITTTYAADMTLQNTSTGFDQGAVDFMTASLTGCTKSTSAVKFDFDHCLAMLTLSIKPNDSVESLEGLTVKLEDANTKANFSTITGLMIGAASTPDDVEFLSTTVSTDSSGNVVELESTMILLPGALATGAVLTFDFGTGESYTAVFPTNPTFVAGYNHTYSISVGYAEADFTGESSINEWEENKDIDQSIIDAEEDKAI